MTAPSPLPSWLQASFFAAGTVNESGWLALDVSVFVVVSPHCLCTCWLFKNLSQHCSCLLSGVARQIVKDCVLQAQGLCACLLVSARNRRQRRCCAQTHTFEGSRDVTYEVEISQAACIDALPQPARLIRLVLS